METMTMTSNEVNDLKEIAVELAGAQHDIERVTIEGDTANNACMRHTLNRVIAAENYLLDQLSKAGEDDGVNMDAIWARHGKLRRSISDVKSNARIMRDGLTDVLFGLTHDADNNDGQIDRVALTQIVRDALAGGAK